MKNEISFIWDLDGTLLDSYDVIVNALYDVFKLYDIKISKEEIENEAIKHSVSYLLNHIVLNKNVSFDEIKNTYSKITEENNHKIIPMPGAIKLLDKLLNKNIKSYVFTHRGLSTEFVLKNINMYDYFTEIVTSKSGFNRKPSPDGINYLVKKYKLDKSKTFYVGDRALDIECAYNANVKSILYLPKNGITIPTGKEDYIVDDLLKILDIIK